jgi:imidazolonepropionase-like amidohydrolase
MQLLKKHHHNDNEILALLTANPAEILGKENQFGKLEVGMEANFLVAEGIPGLEITDIEKIKKVFYKGRQVVNRL